MMRGFRGATTVQHNESLEILSETKKLTLEVIQKNGIQPRDISHIFFSVTEDINDTFPAKAAREIEGFTHVPVMCMKEINVPNSLAMCIRLMLVAQTELQQDMVHHVFLNDAVSLRPDLGKSEGE